MSTHDRAVPRLTSETLAAVANAMVRIMAQHYGKGPVQARAYQNDDVLVCVMKGGLTTVEQTLLEAGDEALVREVRLTFQQRMDTTFRGTVERLTGRRVLNYASQVMFDPTYVLEFAVLGEPVGASDGRPAAANGARPRAMGGAGFEPA